MVDLGRLVGKPIQIDATDPLKLFESLDRKGSHTTLRPAQVDALTQRGAHMGRYPADVNTPLAERTGRCPPFPTGRWLTCAPTRRTGLESRSAALMATVRELGRTAVELDFY
jgi:hypothetical protein